MRIVSISQTGHMMCGNLGYTHNPFLVAVPDLQETVIPYVFWNLAHISGGGSGGGYAILSRNTGYAGCIRQKGQKKENEKSGNGE